MKIALLVCRFPPYRGGMGQVALAESEGLTALAHDVTVFTSDYSQEAEEKNFIFKVERLKSPLKFGNSAFLPQLFWQLKKYDAVILHYPFFGVQEWLWLLKWLGLVKKLIVYYHLDYVAAARHTSLSLRGVAGGQKAQKHRSTEAQKTLIGYYFLKVVGALSLFVSWPLFRLADKILVSSLDYINNSQIKNYYLKHQSKFIEVPLGVDVPVALPVTRGADRQDKYILFVGNLDQAHYFKGVDILLKAWQRLIYDLRVRDYQLRIVGDGDWRSRYEDLARDLGLLKKVKFLGGVSDGELNKLYYNCAFLVLPSTTRGEAFGLVLVEAMAHGKAVIASDWPGVRTVCQAGFSGLLVKPGDAADLAEKMQTLITDDKARNLMGERGQLLVVEKYNWQKHNELLRQAIEAG